MQTESTGMMWKDVRKFLAKQKRCRIQWYRDARSANRANNAQNMKNKIRREHHNERWQSTKANFQQQTWMQIACTGVEKKAVATDSQTNYQNICFENSKKMMTALCNSLKVWNSGPWDFKISSLNLEIMEIDSYKKVKER